MPCKDKQKQHEWYLKYYREHKEERLAYSKKYNKKNRQKRLEYATKYRETNHAVILEKKKEYYRNNKDKHRYWMNREKIETPWVESYYNARARCNNKTNHAYKRYGGRGIVFRLTRKDMEHLWYRDNADMMDCATIDRIDNDGNYILSNCRFIEKTENSKKMWVDRKEAQ